MSDMCWHPDDKQWMKERKEQWRTVKQHLEVISSCPAPLLKRKYHKYHQELFFHGEILTHDQNCFSGRPGKTGGDAFLSVLPVFQVWYHPQPEQLDFSELRKSYFDDGLMSTLRVRFFDDLFGAGSGRGRHLFSAAEGMMNGREELVVKLSCPGFDYKRIVSELDNPNKPDGQEEGVAPSFLYVWLTFHTRYELMRDARFVPYAPGQYLWEHLSYTLEHYPDEMFKTKRDADGSIREQKIMAVQELIAEILAFENRTDKSRRRPSTIAMVERLINMYERKHFSDPLLKLWDKAKQNIDRLLESSSSSIYHDILTLAQDDHIPVKIQEERLSQWKQV